MNPISSKTAGGLFAIIDAVGVEAVLRLLYERAQRNARWEQTSEAASLAVAMARALTTFEQERQPDPDTATRAAEALAQDLLGEVVS